MGGGGGVGVPGGYTPLTGLNRYVQHQTIWFSGCFCLKWIWFEHTDFECV